MRNAHPWSGFAYAILIALVAFGLRIKAARALPVDHDERAYFPASQRYSLALSSRSWSQIIDEDYNAEHPPHVKILYGMILSSSGKQAPTSDPGIIPYEPFHLARDSSAVLGGLQALILALINPLAGFILAIHTWQIKYTSQIMLESLPSLTSLLAVLAYQKSGGKRNTWLLLSAAALGLTAASKYIYALVGIAIVLHWLWSSHSEIKPFRITGLWRWLIPVVLWGSISVGIFFLSDPHLWRDPAGRLIYSFLLHRTYIQLNAAKQIVFPFWQPLIWLSRSAPPDPGAYYFSVDPVIALFALLGINRLIRKHLVFAIWLFVVLVFLLVWPTKWPQYILVLTVPLTISASEGIYTILSYPYIHRLPGLFPPIGRFLPGEETSIRRGKY